MQKNREEDQPSQPVRDQESRGDGDAIKKRVDDQSQQDGIAAMHVREFLLMGFFAEMKMRGDRMLKKVDDQVPNQDKQRRRFAAQFDAFRDHLDKGCGQHESRAQRNEVARKMLVRIGFMFISTEYLVPSTETKPSTGQFSRVRSLRAREFMRPLKIRLNSSVLCKSSSVLVPGR